MLGKELTPSERTALFGSFIISQAVSDQIDKKMDTLKLRADPGAIVIISEALKLQFGPKNFGAMTLEQASDFVGKPPHRLNFGDVVNPFDVIDQNAPNIGPETYQIHKQSNIPNAQAIVNPLFEGDHPLDLNTENLLRGPSVISQRLAAFRKDPTLGWDELQARFPLVELVESENMASYPRIVVSSPAVS